MCGVSKPKASAPPPPTPAPETIDPQAIYARDRERRRVRSRYGQQSTILTSGIDSPVTGNTKTLLGQ